MPARFELPPAHLRLVDDPGSRVRAGGATSSSQEGPTVAEPAPRSGARPWLDQPAPKDADPAVTGSPKGRRAVHEYEAQLGDAHWVALAKADQRRAFEILYKRHAPYAMALAVRVQGHSADVEDIVHDAFLRAFDRLDSLRSGDAFRSWLASVVVSLVKTRLRRRRFLGALGMSSSEPIDLDALASAEAGPDVRAQIAQLYDTLRRLPVDQRVAWTLRHVAGHKLEDVAEVSGCSLATAKRWIAAAQREVLASDLVQLESDYDNEPASALRGPSSQERTAGADVRLPSDGRRS